MRIQFKTFIFRILIIELIIGGGGRLFDFDGITLRMIIFSVAIFVSFFDIYQGKTNEITLGLVLLNLSLLAFFFINGLQNRADISLIIEDIKPLSYFLILPFLYSRIRNKNDLNFIINSLKWGGLFMSIIFVGLAVALSFDKLDSNYVYFYLNSTQDFFFKGDISFYYKGFIFLPIAFHLLLKEKKILFALIVFTAIILTQTRGLYILTFFGFIYFYFRSKQLYLIIIPSVLCYSILYYSQLERLFLNPDSDYIRFTQIKEVFQMMDIKTFVIGHGFGVGTETRPIHMEIGYLEILHKQGIIGIFYFLFLYVTVHINSFNSNESEINIIGFTTILLFIQSFFNSYLLNPIGISFVLINLIAFLKFKLHES